MTPPDIETTTDRTTAKPAQAPADPSRRARPVKLTRPDVSLADKYELEQGTIFLSGIQALVRVLLDQHRADARRGVRTATFASGYQGSPLGGLDKEIMRLRGLAADHLLHFVPGLNEELAATAVYGTQLAMGLPDPKYDGVVGVWYGKNPGLDRAMDAIRHANFAGTSPTGGVLALVGDDPSCKSSTLPSAGEATLATLQIPTVFPGTLQEVLDLGLHAIACSRRRRWSSSARCSASGSRSRANTRSSTSSTRSACRRATHGSGSSLRARSTTSCCRRCATSGSTTASSSAPASA